MTSLPSYSLKLNRHTVAYDIYEYVSANNPLEVKAIINKYGFSFTGVETATDLGEMLKQVVGEVGISALKDVVAIHPDRDLILEDNGLSQLQPSTAKGGCGCGGCGKKSGKSIAEEYVNSVQHSSGLSLQQGNLFLISAALILAVAIVSK